MSKAHFVIVGVVLEVMVQCNDENKIIAIYNYSILYNGRYPTHPSILKGQVSVPRYSTLRFR